jgi:antitoxin CptB
MEGKVRVRKLKWLCRRGMKELDLLLERFIDANLQSLSAGSWPELETMLQTEDDILWDWLQAPGKSSPDVYRRLLTHIRGEPD